MDTRKIQMEQWVSQSKEFISVNEQNNFALFVIKKSIRTIKKKKIDYKFSAIHQEKELFSIALQRLY